MEHLKREARRLSNEWRGRIGTSIRRIRESRKITQSDLAALVGVDIATISKTELGKTVPDFATLEAIADILAVSIDELVGRQRLTPPSDVSDEAGLHSNPWPVIALLQAQVDEMRREMQQMRDQPPESATRRSPKGRRTG